MRQPFDLLSDSLVHLKVRPIAAILKSCTADVAVAMACLMRLSG